MRQGLNTRRSRGRGNPRGRHPQQFRNQQLDSNGPEGRIRGTANQIYDRYLALARDAQGSGDAVLVENLLQHAEHYFRLMNANGSAAPFQQQQNRPRLPGEEDGREEEMLDGGEVQAGRPRLEPGPRPDMQPQRDGERAEGERRGAAERAGGEPREGGEAQPYVRRDFDNGSPDLLPRRLREAGGNDRRDQRPSREQRPRPDQRSDQGPNQGLPAFLAPPSVGNGAGRPQPAGVNGGLPAAPARPATEAQPVAAPQEQVAPAPVAAVEPPAAPAAAADETAPRPRRRRAAAGDAQEPSAEPRPRARRTRRPASEASGEAATDGAAPAATDSPSA